MRADDLKTLRRIASYYLSGAGGDVDIVEVPPFTVVLNRASDAWYLSYATTTVAVADADDALAEIIELFQRRDRTVAFEWIGELAPGLDGLLERHGLPTPKGEPLLAVSADTLVVPDIAGASARVVGADEDLRAVLRVSHTAIPELGEVTDAELRRVASEIRDGQRVQVAVDVDGAPVAVGDHSPAGGVTEIAGIATLEAHRRRGLGGLVTATLAAEALERGCDVVYLTAASNAAARVYERLGFGRIGTGMATHAPV